MNVRLERATHVTKEQEWTLIRMDLIVISVILGTFVRGRRESSSFWSRHGFQRKSVEEATSKHARATWKNYVWIRNFSLMQFGY